MNAVELGNIFITESRTAMDNRGTSVIVLFLRAPHTLEGAEGGQDRTSDPDRVLALRRCDNLNLSELRKISPITKKRRRRNEPWCLSRELLMHAVADAREHSGASTKNDITEKITADVKVAFEDRVVAESESHQRLR